MMKEKMEDTCKRPGCKQPAEARPRYEGYCSLSCLDYDELRKERNTLVKLCKTLSELLARANNLTSQEMRLCEEMEKLLNEIGHTPT